MLERIKADLHGYGPLAQRPNAGQVGDKALYYATDDNGGTLSQVQAGAWVRLAPKGTELQYAQNTTDVPGISTAADVTGLSITFTVGDRPVYVDAGFPLIGQVTSAGQPTLFITDPSGTPYTSTQPPSIAAGAFDRAYIAPYRFPAGTGVVTAKVRASTTGGTLTVFSANTRRSFIRAIEA